MKSIRLSFLAGLFLIACGCVQVENSSSLDSTIYGDIPGSIQFQAARTVLQSCQTCHDWNSQTESALIASGQVVPGDAEGSKLYFRIEGSSGINGPKNMKTSAGSALSSRELDVIKIWINSITP